jgi:transposase
MPPAYVKPYVKRGKTDAGDAEAIYEAVTRPTMRFVAMKSEQQQAALALHWTRDLLVKQRTQLVNMIRGLLAEFGIEMACGLHHALKLAARITSGTAPNVPELAMRIITSLAGKSVICRSGLPRWRRSCWPGIAPVSFRSGSRPCPAWVCLARPPWRLR